MPSGRRSFSAHATSPTAESSEKRARDVVLRTLRRWRCLGTYAEQGEALNTCRVDNRFESGNEIVVRIR